MSLRVGHGGEVLVRAPKRVSEREIEDFVIKNSEWIRKQKSKMSEFIPLTKETLKELAFQSKAYLPERVKLLAERHGFKYQRVTCRHQKSRWGSCSHRNSISLNIELMRLPMRLRDYIIIHELTHTVHKHHQKAFWNHLERVLPKALELDREMKDWKIGLERKAD